jgi:DNA-directed RNA polymerase specialized sigma24 family protein
MRPTKLVELLSYPSDHFQSTSFKDNSLLVELSTHDTNKWSTSFNKTLLVALSTADTNKWSTLLNQGLYESKPASTITHDERSGPIRQRQRRLSDVQIQQMTTRYLEGATVYELAVEFDICRSKVSERLKKSGVRMRLQSPTDQEISEMVRLYVSGLSLAAVSKNVGMSVGTVKRYVVQYGVDMRDTHGRLC